MKEKIKEILKRSNDIATQEYVHHLTRNYHRSLIIDFMLDDEFFINSFTLHKRSSVDTMQVLSLGEGVTYDDLVQAFNRLTLFVRDNISFDANVVINTCSAGYDFEIDLSWAQNSLYLYFYAFFSSDSECRVVKEYEEVTTKRLKGTRIICKESLEEEKALLT